MDDPFQYFWYLLILTYFDPLAWQEPHGRLLLCKVHLLPLGTPDDLISNQSSSSYPQGGVTPIWTKMNWTPQSAKSLLPDRCKRAGRRVWCLISSQLQTGQIPRDLPDILGEYVLLFGVVWVFLAQTLSQFGQREVAGSECCRVELGETAKWLWESIPPPNSPISHIVSHSYENMLGWWILHDNPITVHRLKLNPQNRLKNINHQFSTDKYKHFLNIGSPFSIIFHHFPSFSIIFHHFPSFSIVFYRFLSFSIIFKPWVQWPVGHMTCHWMGSATPRCGQRIHSLPQQRCPRAPSCDHGTSWLWPDVTSRNPSMVWCQDGAILVWLPTYPNNSWFN